MSRFWGESPKLVAVVGVGLAILVGILALLATPKGLAIGQRDAPTYLASSESLAAGNGYTTPFGDPSRPIDFNSESSVVIHYPPGYPKLLSLGVTMGFDSHDVARILGVILLSLLSFGFFEFARRRRLGGSGSVLVALVAAAVSFPYVLEPISELTYGLLTLATLVLLERYASRRTFSFLAVASGVAALGLTVRYIGLALVATVIIVALIVPSGLKSRILRASFVGGVGWAVLTMWLVSDSSEFVWHPPLAADWAILTNAVAGWFVPPLGGPTQRVAVLIVAVSASVMWIILRHRSGEETNSRTAKDLPLWIPGAVAAGAHLMAALGTRALFNAQTRPSTRILYPIAISLLVAAVEWSASNRTGTARVWRMRRVVSIFGIAVLLAGAWVAVIDATAVRRGELGFRSASFLESAGVVASTKVDGSSVFSNVPDGLWVAGLTGVRSTPARVDPFSLRANEILESEVDELRSNVEGRFAVILFYKLHQRPYLLGEPDIRAIAPCVVSEDNVSVLLSGFDHPLCGG